MVIKDAKITNQHMCDEKKKSLQDRDEATVRRAQLEQAISRVCNELLELQIHFEVASEDKANSWPMHSENRRHKWIKVILICIYKLLSFN